jgi:hypothetical protein
MHREVQTSRAYSELSICAAVVSPTEMSVSRTQKRTSSCSMHVGFRLWFTVSDWSRVWGAGSVFRVYFRR